MFQDKTFKILDTLQQRLDYFSKNVSEINKKGIIFGFTPVSQNNLSYCVGCAQNLDDIPFGNILTGAYFLENCNEESILNFCNELCKEKKSGKLLVYSNKNSEKQILFYDIKSKKFTECTYQIVNYLESLELLVQIELDCIFNLKFDGFENNIKNIIENLESSNFCLEKSNFKIKEDTPNMNIEDLYNQMEEFDEFIDVQIPLNMKKKIIEKNQRQLRTKKSIIHFKLETNLEKPSFIKNIILEKEKIHDFNMEMKIFYNLQLQNNLQQLKKIFINSLKKLFTDLEKYFMSDDDQENYSFSVPKMVNFYESSVYTHIITVIYFDIDCQEKYKDQRKNIHLKYLVPMTNPTFKLNNALDCNLVAESNKLINVHIGLNSGLKNGQCAIVKGKYFYFHYNQDHFEDSGWGCAYRSLQTIISWFQLQAYIDVKAIPTHKDIQQALIEVGDKPANFLGSTKWIGTQEVCYVLNHLYGIESKIIYVNSGTELLDKARDLIQHFLKNGTPVMIGGGVLAHTIIGVDFDETIGNVKYLVLDPHYVGEEDITNIIKKNGCSWKSVSFWDKNSFYNLCLPQVPNDY